jgi:hypothetical protein|nr:hypothetical protein [uncultured Campylobacter sp.]
MTNAEIAKKLRIAEKTIYNWRKNRKELIEILEIGIKFQENQKNLEYVNNTYQELIKLFEQLNPKEQEYYTTSMKARILKREIDE